MIRSSPSPTSTQSHRCSPPPMLSIIKRLFSTPWTYCLTRIRYFWTPRLAFLFSRSPFSTTNLRPLTDQQRKLRADVFTNSIDTEAIRALASKSNGGLLYSIEYRQ
ncbi:hypothetical protein V2G26_019506 [Clonostachys chloroleuca]